MTKRTDSFHGLLAAIAVCGVPLFVSANPIPPPDAEIFEFCFIVTAAICFTIEVIVTMMMFKLFHDIDKSLPLVGTLYLLNVVTFTLVLVPLIRFSGSVILGEVGVVLAEMVGIRTCLAALGSDTTWRRSLAYSLVANMLSIIISLSLR
ncbi:MAG: hypothetical protein WCK89_20195 [bacterium]